ncbi:TetR/AcrR family transcriptional regulator [Brevibacterium sp. CFH 10365]|uniref:TetR/AcrR family transcriptional regulator n=1 Tax=Brevibacterium sp. CFH 10365 TaxID=2585207 RepID=UPI00126681A1|nr:TetR/AcrR family transcriptional regulator [Brevibacterium sp. CFH 10365]
MGRKKSFDEQTVIDAAISVFSEHGYAGTDVGLVCDRAGIGRSSFYNTFDSLDAVFLRALRDYTATGIPLREELDHSAEPAPVLLMHRLGGELEKQCEDENRTGCLSANTAAELGREVDSVCSILDPDRDAWLSTYAGIIERGQTSGHILDDLDPRIHAQLIHSVLAGLRTAARVMTTENVLAQARAFVTGLCTPAGRATLNHPGAPGSAGASTKGSPTR